MQRSYQLDQTQQNFAGLILSPKDAFPYQTAAALQYDVGDYEPLLKKSWK